MLPELAQPTNSKALALYSLIECGDKGMTNYEAVVRDRSFKFNTRTSDLVLKHGVIIEKTIESGENRFKHPISSTRYKLRTEDLEKNIAIYNSINADKKEKKENTE